MVLPVDVSSGYPLAEPTAQTFTAGITGQLTEVDLRAWIDFTRGGNTGVPQISIAGPPGISGGLDGLRLAAVNVPLADFPDFALDDYLKLDLTSQHVMVTAGEVYRIAISAPFNNVYWGTGPGSITDWPYHGGTPQFFDSGHWHFVGQDLFEFNFKTFVQPIPEPSSLVLAAFGFVGLAVWGWRRRKRFQVAR